jgi:hypothetical protein
LSISLDPWGNLWVVGSDHNLYKGNATVTLALVTWKTTAPRVVNVFASIDSSVWITYYASASATTTSIGYYISGSIQSVNVGSKTASYVLSNAIEITMAVY